MGKEIDIEEDFDFGFTSANEKDIEHPSSEKVEKIYKMIMPLLKNLAKDADKNDYIHWPNRKEKIEQFIKKIEAVKNS